MSLKMSNILVIFRIKMMQGEAPHSQLDAEMAAGMGKPDNGPSLRLSDMYTGL